MTARDPGTEGSRDRGNSAPLDPSVPGSLGPFFDLQVNGYAGVDFNHDDLSAHSLHAMCQRLKRDGVAGILATVITDDLSKMCSRLRRLVELREHDELARQMIAGIHIEGPFLSAAPGYIGAHPAAHARPADLDVLSRLLDAAGGLTKLVTLAPERDRGFHVTRRLADRGIVVSAGHTDATYDELRAALDAGLSMFTHLGNGCPLVMARHNNIIQRVLSLAERFTAISFIADGAHVPLFVLRNYLRLAGDERTVIVSDAMSAAGLGPGQYTLGDQSVVIGEDLAPRNAGGYLMGSACPLGRMVQNLRALEFEASRIEQWTTRNPRRLLSDVAPVPARAPA
jgi:N-acetylglucosamine-6-phosphate deacetylase